MLTPEELKIVERAKELGKKPEDAIAGIQKYRASMVKPATTMPATPEKTGGFMQTAKDLGIGALKGLGDTVNGLAKIGRPVTDRISGALDPFKTVQDYQNIKSPLTDEMLKSDNNTQKVGKGIELVAELLFPVGKVAQGIGLTEKAGKVAGASFDDIGARISAMGDDVLESGVKVKDQMINLVTNLDDKTKTALSRTPIETFKEYMEVGKKAMKDDKNITPYEVVGNKIIDALKQVKSRASSVGSAKSQIMETAKVGYTKVGNIAQRTALDIQKAFNGMKLDPADARIAKDFQTTLMNLGDNPRLKDVDAAIDLLQDRLYKAGRSNTVEITDRITGKLRQSIGKLNGEVKNLGGKAYSQANDEYAKAADLVRELNARLGKEGSSAGSLVKRLFSPSDARTKELFKELEKLTGQDFFRDARLAKFVMEALDDSRAYSMLEQIPRSASGAIERVVDWGVKKVSDPLKAAENFIKNK